MRVFVTGAGGFIGGAISSALLDAGHEVVATARRVEGRHSRPGLTWHQADFAADLRPEAWLRRLEGIDAVVNAAGIIRERPGASFEDVHHRGPVAVFSAAKQAGVGRVVQISAAGAEVHCALPFLATKAAADKALGELYGDYGWVVLRPSVVYGVDGESARLFRRLATLPLVPILGDGDYPMQPIHVRDVARAVLLALEGDACGAFDLGGAETVTLRGLLLALRGWLGEPESGPTLGVPLALVRLGARVTDLTGRGPINSAELRMLSESRARDLGPFAEAFGFEPRGLLAVLASQPAGMADRWHPRLELVRTPLRLLVASIWLITPIVTAIEWEHSLALLGRAGFSGVTLAPLLVGGACAIELCLALALVFRWRVRLVCALQLGMLLFFTGVLTATQPELWLDPFGAVAKNLPIIGATLAVLALE